MSLNGHIESLSLKHQQLESQISEEYTHPYPDLTRLKELKLRKLKIKQEISEAVPKPANMNKKTGP